uniref:ATP synthase F0 subunit 8 n=1 Tax=Cylindratus longicephalus TaxID=2886265 RepID=UPI001E6CEE86|nr:ATP synthase F0 subunit 8 [Cylindratus longicephalus]UDL72035.1 ATP synthase F0 subunit 8 [Cylindratus longicephalus]
MPQMSPIMWNTLMMMMFILIIQNSSMIIFNKNKIMKKNKFKKNESKYKLKW